MISKILFSGTGGQGIQLASRFCPGLYAGKL